MRPALTRSLSIAVTIACAWCATQGAAQVVFEPSANPVYGFLDEMAAVGHIRINTFGRPWARTYIAARLDSLHAHHRASLNARQRAELDFYLRDFGKELHTLPNWNRRTDLLYRREGSVVLTLNPILAGSLSHNENGTLVHRRIGAEFWASAGKVGMFGSLRDNTVNHTLALAEYLNVQPGQNYKTLVAGRNDFNEAMGGITYQWAWGDVGLVKDRLIWGNHRSHAHVLSGRAPSTAHLYLRMYPFQWLDFQYIHGWLVSEVPDSARTFLIPRGTRRVMSNKNIAANFLTIKTRWNIDFTAGNSIVYSDAGFQPAYFIPFMFFKSVDHAYNGTGSNELGQNAQMFFDISVRSLRHIHLWLAIFMDELNMGNLWSPSQHTNIWSIKMGATRYNALPNVHLTAEYTRNAPWTYRHQVPTTTFASNGYNLGHFMGENADELYAAADWRPRRALLIRLAARHIRKGPEHVYEIVQGNANVTGLPFMEHVAFRQMELRAEASYEWINGVALFTAWSWHRSTGEAKYVPPYLSGNVTTLEAGFRIGW